MLARASCSLISVGMAVFRALSSLGTAHLQCRKSGARGTQLVLLQLGLYMGWPGFRALSPVAAQRCAGLVWHRVLVQPDYSVGWAEHALQCWQPREWAPKMVPISSVTSNLGLDYKNGIFQSFCPWIKSPQVPASPETALKLVIESLSLTV